MAEPVGASDGAGCAAVRRMSYRPSHWPLVRTLDTVAVDVGAGLRRVPRFVGCDASLLACGASFSIICLLRLPFYRYVGASPLSRPTRLARRQFAIHGSQPRNLVSTTPINAVDCSSVSMAGWRPEVGVWIVRAGCVAGRGANVIAGVVRIAHAAQSCAGARHLKSNSFEAQMKKAQRFCWAFIKFGCGGRI